MHLPIVSLVSSKLIAWSVDTNQQYQYATTLSSHDSLANLSNNSLLHNATTSSVQMLVQESNISLASCITESATQQSIIVRVSLPSQRWGIHPSGTYWSWATFIVIHQSTSYPANTKTHTFITKVQSLYSKNNYHSYAVLPTKSVSSIQTINQDCVVHTSNISLCTLQHRGESIIYLSYFAHHKRKASPLELTMLS